MSQKAICPRGHIWDPSTLAGLPPTATPRCPICGEEESPNVRNRLAHLNRWVRNHPVGVALSILCLLLAVSVIYVLLLRQELLMAREEAEKARAEAMLRQRPHLVQAVDKEQQRDRQAELQAARWREREKEFAAQLREAEKTASETRRQRDEQIHLRKLAEELAQTAEQVRQEALSRRAETARQLIKMQVAAGTRLMENGDLSDSLLWFTEALRLAEKEKLPTQTHRLRLAAVLAQCPRPVQLWMHDKTMNVVQLSSDGRRVLSAGANGALEIWDVASGKRIGDVLAHEGAITHAAFSPDGKRVLTAVADMTLHLWDLEMAKELFSSVQLRGPVVGLSFSADGKRFLTVTDKAPMGATEVELHVWDAATGEAVREAALGSDLLAHPAEFSPDGQRVLTICQDRCARIWDIASGKQIGPAFAHTADLLQASFSLDGERVLTASVDGMARVWKTKTGEPLTLLLKHGSTVRGASLSADGKYALTYGEDRGVRVWDVSKGEATGPALRHAETVSDAFFSPDSRYVLTTCEDDTARLWDYRTSEEVLPALHHGEPIRYAAYSAGGDGLLTLAGRVVRLWDLTQGEIVGWLKRSETHHTRPGLEVFSSDGKRVLRTTETAVRVYDTQTNQPVGGTLPHKNKVTAAAFSPDGKRVLTVCHQPNGDELEGHVRVWETETGELLGQPLVHPRSVLEASFSRDGRRVLTACQDGKARLWDVEKNSLVGEPMEHKQDLSQAVFSPDGKRFLTVSGDRRVRVWDASNGKPISPPLRHRSAVTLAAFSDDGKQIVTVAGDGLRIWEAVSGEPISPLLRDGRRAGNVNDGKATVAYTSSSLTLFRAEDRPVAELARVAEVLSAERLMDAGEVVPLDSAELSKEWQDVHAKYGKDFAPSPQRLAAWHRAGAEECEQQRLWVGVLKHLDCLISAGASADLYARRGRADLELRRWEAAKADYTQALAGDSERWELLAGRAEAEAALGRWQEAMADYSKAINHKSNRAELWAARGRIEAERGDWPKAAADLGKAVSLGEQDVAVWRQQVLALLASNDETNYRRWCGRLVQRFGDSKDEAIFRSVVWTVVLAEGTVRDWKPLVQRAERSAQQRRQLAVLLYRTGQFDAALKRLQELMEVSPSELSAPDGLVAALAALRLGRAEEGKKWLDKAKQIRRERAKLEKESWEDLLIFETLEREAEMLTKTGKD